MKQTLKATAAIIGALVIGNVIIELIIMLMWLGHDLLR